MIVEVTFDHREIIEALEKYISEKLKIDLYNPISFYSLY